MKRIILYLGAILALDVFFLWAMKLELMPSWWYSGGLVLTCTLVGGIGGTVYCLRGIYLNACVRKSWDKEWQPWYYIRPIVSHVCGGVSSLFLRAGLIVLEAHPSAESTEIGYLALAFIAGLNVDNFIRKIEEIARSVWGIEKSRTSKDTE